MILVHDCQKSYSDRWLEYCYLNGVEVERVDIFSSSIVETVKSRNASGLLCHPPMAGRRSALPAKNILLSLALSGIKVFPSLRDFWHFDDKVAQKYLFESNGIPTPRTWVFYNQDEAFDWIKSADFPVVFKLRSGAGSTNVHLLKTARQAERFTRKMFGRGFYANDNFVKDFGTKVYKHTTRGDWSAAMQRLPATAWNWLELRAQVPRERGYIYFQDYMRGNKWDTKITMIGGRAFAFRRMVRPNDFRASGSGRIDYEPSNIDKRCVELAFACSHKLRSTCMAYDMVFNGNGDPVVVEMSYGFIVSLVSGCPGYWDHRGTWYPGHIVPQDLIIRDFLDGHQGVSETPASSEIVSSLTGTFDAI